MIGKQCQRQLRRPAAAIAPLEPGRTVVIQIQPGIEGTAVHRNDDGMAFTASCVTFHAFLLSIWLTSPKRRSARFWFLGFAVLAVHDFDFGMGRNPEHKRRRLKTDRLVKAGGELAYGAIHENH